MQQLIAAADVVIAVGTEFGPTDYDMYGEGGFAIPGALIRAEIDAVQLMRIRVPELALLGDAGAAVRGLLERLGGRPRDRGGAERAAAAREAAFAALSPAMQKQIRFVDLIRDALPRAVIVGDSTQAVYAGNLYFEPARGPAGSTPPPATARSAMRSRRDRRQARRARPAGRLPRRRRRPAVHLGELGSAIDAGTPIIVLAWNNLGYGEIKSYFLARGIAPEGVDLTTPDFVAIARAYGWQTERLAALGELAERLRAAAERTTPTLIEVGETVAMS